MDLEAQVNNIDYTGWLFIHGIDWGSVNKGDVSVITDYTISSGAFVIIEHEYVFMTRSEVYRCGKLIPDCKLARAIYLGEK